MHCIARGEIPKLQIHSHRSRLLVIPISNQVPTILLSFFQATNYEDIARGQTVPDEVPNGLPFVICQQELNGNPYCSVITAPSPPPPISTQNFGISNVFHNKLLKILIYNMNT